MVNHNKNHNARQFHSLYPEAGNSILTNEYMVLKLSWERPHLPKGGPVLEVLLSIANVGGPQFGC